GAPPPPPHQLGPRARVQPGQVVTHARTVRHSPVRVHMAAFGSSSAVREERRPPRRLSSRLLKKPPAPRDPLHEGRDPFFSTLLVDAQQPLPVGAPVPDPRSRGDARRRAGAPTGERRGAAPPVRA